MRKVFLHSAMLAGTLFGGGTIMGGCSMPSANLPKILAEENLKDPAEVYKREYLETFADSIDEAVAKIDPPLAEKILTAVLEKNSFGLPIFSVDNLMCVADRHYIKLYNPENRKENLLVVNFYSLKDKRVFYTPPQHIIDAENLDITSDKNLWEASYLPNIKELSEIVADRFYKMVLSDEFADLEVFGQKMRPLLMFPGAHENVASAVSTTLSGLNLDRSILVKTNIRPSNLNQPTDYWAEKGVPSPEVKNIKPLHDSPLDRPR